MEKEKKTALQHDIAECFAIKHQLVSLSANKTLENVWKVLCAF